jgi:hypothetical protein
MSKFMVTLRRKDTRHYEVEAKNRNQARRLVEQRVVGTSLDCREDYGEEINDKSHPDEHQDYITSVEPVARVTA